jgi:hypothetical protein
MQSIPEPSEFRDSFRTDSLNQVELEAFLDGLPDVQQSEAYGYKFYFVGDDHRLPFTTIASSDNEYDNVSNLDREGVYRVKIGVSRETFKRLFGPADSADVDYTALNVFLPHPDYAKQNFICILSPAGGNVEATRQLILEAHSIAAVKAQRKADRDRS